MDLAENFINNNNQLSASMIEQPTTKKSKFYLNKNGDFYSSNEYVKYSNQNIYENGNNFYALIFLYEVIGFFKS